MKRTLTVLALCWLFAAMAPLAGAPIPTSHPEVTAEQAAEVLAENTWINDESLSSAIEAKSKTARQAVDILRDTITEKELGWKSHQSMFLGGKGRDLSFLAVAVESGVWLIHIDYVGEMVLTNSTWVLWDISGHNVAEGKVQLP